MSLSSFHSMQHWVSWSKQSRLQFRNTYCMMEEFVVTDIEGTEATSGRGPVSLRPEGATWATNGRGTSHPFLLRPRHPPYSPTRNLPLFWRGKLPGSASTKSAWPDWKHWGEFAMGQLTQPWCMTEESEHKMEFPSWVRGPIQKWKACVIEGSRSTEGLLGPRVMVKDPSHC